MSLNTGLSLASELASFFSHSSTFTHVRQKLDRAFPILGKVRRYTWQELARLGPPGLEMHHIHRVGGLLAVGGSTTLAVQGNSNSSGVAWYFSKGLLRAEYKCMDFQTFPLECAYPAAKGVAAACAGLPTLNEIELTQELITYNHKNGPEACINS